jgi:benzoyl-CoA reductase subunit C
MTMNRDNKSALKTLTEALQDPHQAAQKDREKGFPIFGYLTEYVPLELIYAADILPIRVQGGSISTLASEHLQTFSCSYCRTVIHEAMKGEYDYLDGLISAKTCDVALPLFQVWTYRKSMKFNWLLSLPGNKDDSAVLYFREELSHFRKALETFRKVTISDQKIERTTLLYNEYRGLVNQIWQKKNDGSLGLTGKEIIGALKGSQLLAPEDSLNLLKDLVKNGERKDVSSRKGIPLILLGNVFFDLTLIEMIEKSGGQIMVDDTAATGRHFDGPVVLQGDPLTSLARYYTAKISGDYRLAYEDHLEHVLQLIRKWNIKASILLLQKFCDSSFFASSLFVQSLKDHGIPSLVLEIDDTSPALGPMETRIQAFLEMVGGIV